MSNDVTWKMTRSNTTIRLEYRFENTTPQTVYVNDGIVVALQGGGHFQAKNFLIETTRDPAVASVRIARPTGDVPAAVVPPGFYVPVAPKASFAGSRVIELPLRRRDAMGREHALPATIKNIAFAIEVFDGEPPAWREVKAKDGTPIKFPEGHSPRLVEGGVQPIP